MDRRRQPKHSRFEMTSRHPCLSARQCRTPVSRAPSRPLASTPQAATYVNLRSSPPRDPAAQSRDAMGWPPRQQPVWYLNAFRSCAQHARDDWRNGGPQHTTCASTSAAKAELSAELSMNLMPRMLPLLLYAAHRGPCLIILAQSRLFLISEPLLPPPACQPRSPCPPSLPSSDAPGLGV